MGPRAVRVRAPATSANLGPGYDAFGLALGLYDEVVATLAEPGAGTSVEVVGEGAGVVPTDEKHLVVATMRATWERLGVPAPDLTLRCVNRIPHGRGLGSSAAAIVAGVLAARELARELVPGGADPLDVAAMLDLVGELEGHVDNVAACLLGGLTVGWRADGERPAWRAARVEPDPALRVVAYVGRTELSTERARGLIPDTVAHLDAAVNGGRAGLLVAALSGAVTAGSAAGSVNELLLAATEDRLHQDYREPAMPASLALVRALRDRGVPAIVSGAGPTVVAFGWGDDQPSAALTPPPGGFAEEFDVRRLSLAVSGAAVEHQVAQHGET